MKAIGLTFLLVAGCPLIALAADQPAPAKTKYTLVKVLERDDKEVFQVLEPPQLTALQDEIKLEERLYDKALMAAEKAWKADEFTKTKSFPRSAIGHRSCTFVNSYIKREDADKALSAAEERAARAEESKAEAEKKRDETRRRMGNNNNVYAAKKKDPKKAEAEKKGLEDQARDLFATKLADLKAGKPEPKDDPAAPADGKPADAKDAKAPDAKAPGAADAKK